MVAFDMDLIARAVCLTPNGWFSVRAKHTCAKQTIYTRKLQHRCHTYAMVPIKGTLFSIFVSIVAKVSIYG